VMDARPDVPPHLAIVSRDSSQDVQIVVGQTLSRLLLLLSRRLDGSGVAHVCDYTRV
jgi:hypothetical protein